MNHEPNTHPCYSKVTNLCPYRGCVAASLALCFSRLALVRIGGDVCGSCDWTFRSYSPFFCRARTGCGCSAKRGATTAVSYGCGSECALRDGGSSSGTLGVPNLKGERSSCERHVPGTLLRNHCRALPFGIGSLSSRIDWLRSREETGFGTVMSNFTLGFLSFKRRDGLWHYHV